MQKLALFFPILFSPLFQMYKINCWCNVLEMHTTAIVQFVLLLCISFIKWECPLSQSYRSAEWLIWAAPSEQGGLNEALSIFTSYTDFVICIQNMSTVVDFFSDLNIYIYPISHSDPLIYILSGLQRSRLAHRGGQAFSAAALKSWNQLPLPVRQIPNAACSSLVLKHWLLIQIKVHVFFFCHCH